MIGPWLGLTNQSSTTVIWSWAMAGRAVSRLAARVSAAFIVASLVWGQAMKGRRIEGVGPIDCSVPSAGTDRIRFGGLARGLSAPQSRGTPTDAYDVAARSGPGKGRAKSVSDFRC